MVGVTRGSRWGVRGWQLDKVHPSSSKTSSWDVMLMCLSFPSCRSSLGHAWDQLGWCLCWPGVSQLPLSTLPRAEPDPAHALPHPSPTPSLLI